MSKTLHTATRTCPDRPHWAEIKSTVEGGQHSTRHANSWSMRLICSNFNLIVISNTKHKHATLGGGRRLGNNSRLVSHVVMFWTFPILHSPVQPPIHVHVDTCALCEENYLQNVPKKAKLLRYSNDSLIRFRFSVEFLGRRKVMAKGNPGHHLHLLKIDGIWSAIRGFPKVHHLLSQCNAINYRHYTVRTTRRGKRVRNPPVEVSNRAKWLLNAPTRKCRHRMQPGVAFTSIFQ